MHGYLPRMADGDEKRKKQETKKSEYLTIISEYLDDPETLTRTDGWGLFYRQADQPHTAGKAYM